MAEKVRLVMMVDPQLVAALRREASNRTIAHPEGKKVTMSEVLEDLMRDGLADALEEVRQQREPADDKRHKKQ